MHKVDVLFARKDSIYKTFPECDVWDADRDVRNYEPTGRPVICHPPCRGWSSFRHMAKPNPIEYLWPWWCKDLVDKHGGVIEHPATSVFWKKVKPQIVISQWWFGHPCRKNTGLYINGKIPPIPFKLGEAEYKIGTVSKGSKKMRVKDERRIAEHTPPDFARWLIEAVL